MKSAFASRGAMLLIAVSLVSLLALILLLAFAQDLSPDQSDGADALSRSAVGFAGLKDLVTHAGMPTEIGRDPLGRGGARPSLTILTPPPGLTGRELANYGGPRPVQGPVLIVLGKWLTAPMRGHDGWVNKIAAFPTKPMRDQLAAVFGTISVLRAAPKAKPYPAQASASAPQGLVMPNLSSLDQLQTVLGPEALITTPYGSVLAVNRRLSLFVLADPDLIDNHGLANRDNARFALSLIRKLRRGNGPVRFDITLNGFARQPSLLRALFVPPFLGATIAALIAALLMAVHAWARFGATTASAPVFARGRKALAANSADLVRMMHREGAMAPRYLMSARALALEGLGRPHPGQADMLLSALEQKGGPRYGELMQEALAARGGGDLLALARKAYAWRRRITGG